MDKFYASDSDAQLLSDWLLKCGKMYVKEFLTETNGVMATPGATAKLVLDSGVASDDLYNTKMLYIKDDNSKLCKVVIDDSATATNDITVDTTAALQHSDGITAGSFTDAATYSLYILDAERFVGYSTQALTYEEEEAEALDCNEVVRTDVTKVILGFGGDVKSFSVDKVLSNIFNMRIYGSQVGQVRYEAGFNPKVKTKYQVIMKSEKVEDDPKTFEVELFKGTFKGTGLDIAGAGEYKVIPYEFKSLKDILRDAGDVNGCSRS